MADMSERISSLSPRQLEVLRLVAERLSSKEIGRHLGLSPATVDSHIATAIQRLDLGSRREAAILMLRYDAEMSAAPGVDEAEVEQTGLSDRHHGEEPPPHSTMMAVPPGRAHKGPTTSKSPGDSQGDGGRRGARFDGWLRKRADPPRRRGMGHVLFRCFLDAIYIICFFIIISSAAFGAHWVVHECETLKMDPVVIMILRLASYLLVVFDAIGVASATGLLTFRFVRAIMRVDD